MKSFYRPHALTRLDRGIIAAVLVAALGLWGFAELLDEVGEREPIWFDEALLLAFRQPGHPSQPLGPKWLEIAVGDFTALGSFAVIAFVTAAVCGYLVLRRRPGAGLLLLTSVATGSALSSVLKIGVDRPRPDVVPLLAEVHTLSFPSGHAMVSAVAYLTIGVLLARFMPGNRTRFYVLGVAVTTVFLIGLTRLYLGVHWPSDVLAGWCIGGAWAMLCWLAARLLEGRVMRVAPSHETGPDESA